MKKQPTIFVVLLACSFATICHAQDWPQWRGVHRDGVIETTDLKDSFDTLETNWTQPISSGYSGPTVAGGKVYVMDRIAKPNQLERILCFDEKDGTPLWTHKYDCEYRNVGYVAGPRASVTIDNGMAYSLGTMGHAFCLDAKTGEEIWAHDFNKELAIVQSKRMPIWGIAASPIIYNDLVIYHVGGNDGACMLAVDKKTGKERWRTLDDRAQYSSPILTKQNGKDVLVCWTGDSVAGMNPRDGVVYWRHPFKPKNMPIGIATPIVKENHIFLTSFYDGALMLKLSSDSMGVEKVWSAVGPNERSTKALHSIISTPIWIDDHIYGVDSYGELRAIVAKSGERVWEDLSAVPKARWSTIHFVQQNDMTWMFTERGDLLLGKLTPDGLKVTSRTNIISPTKDQLQRRGGVCWTHPAFANGNIIVRNDNEIKSVSLKK